MLGRREPEIYGEDTLESIHGEIRALANKLELDVTCSQHNSEGELIDWFEKAADEFGGVLINAGAYSHYSYALRDAIVAAGVPCIEIHMSNVYGREGFRQKSVIAPVCHGCITGFGKQSYLLALRAIAHIVKDK